MTGKYITQVCSLGNDRFLIAIWNQSGAFLVNRSKDWKGKPSRPIQIEDPRYNSHTTDLKPLFP